ncbi:MAG: hypothetical protein GX994_05370 [Firmicutes bacterium]|nr:hypothetical protein [Bacillota bacterium]
MNQDKLEHYKQLLHEEKAKLKETALAFRDRGIRENLNDIAGELSAYDQHPADYGSQLFERQKDLGLLENIENRIELVNHALEKITSKAYGRCEICHREISEQRLQAVPYAALCINCQEKQEN